MNVAKVDRLFAYEPIMKDVMIQRLLDQQICLKAIELKGVGFTPTPLNLLVGLTGFEPAAP